jgi:hypothetical protein
VGKDYKKKKVILFFFFDPIPVSSHTLDFSSFQPNRMMMDVDSDM